jgi:hypothetical protein
MVILQEKDRWGMVGNDNNVIALMRQQVVVSSVCILRHEMTTQRCSS